MKKKKMENISKKRIWIIVLAIVTVLAASGVFVYYRGTVYYQTHFFPNTIINGIDCSKMEVEPVVELLNARTNEYSLKVTGRKPETGASGTLLGEIAGDEIGLSFTATQEEVTELLNGQDELKWGLAYFEKETSYSLMRSITFESELLEEKVKAWDAFKRINMKKAQDAYIGGYVEELGEYEIVPETLGTELDLDKAVSIIAESVSRQEDVVDLEEQECYKAASVRADDEKLTRTVDTVNSWLGTRIIYDWNGSEVILDRKILKDWVSIDKGSPVLDEEEVKAFVKKQASAYDTYGKTPPS